VNSYSYHADYDPSFPCLQVVIANPDNALRTELLDALIDTGSDGTLVPLVYLEQLNAVALVETGIRSHWGERRRVHLFMVNLLLGDFTLPGVFVVGDDQGDEIILGRNVLNKLRLLLDGPREQTDLLKAGEVM